MKNRTNQKLALALLAALGIPFAASAQYFTSDGLGFNILSAADHTVEVTVNETCTSYTGTIDIPATVEHDGVDYDVVVLGESAFYGATLGGITIPASVTQIKQGCFRDASGLTEIDVPASVTDIGIWAFAAVGLTAINVDEANPNYRSIDGILFSHDTTTLVECPRGKSGVIALPQSTEHIDPCAFFDCKRITGVTLPEGLASIGYWAFMGASHLNDIVIPTSVSSIGDNLFGGCSALTNLNIEAGNPHYYMDGMLIYSTGGDTLVSAHKSADSVFLPSSLRVVYGFGFNSNVRYVHVPDGVTVIGDNAFAHSSLRSIDLPTHLERIEAYAFDYCTSLVRVGMPTTLDTMGRGVFEICTRLASVDIPNGLQTISREAFMYCTSLSQITWGNAVETIDSYAFGNCALSQLQLPPTLRVVRYEAFWKGRKMNRIAFATPVDTIGFGAFDEHPVGTLRLRNTVPPATTDEGYDGAGCLSGTTVDSIIIPCGSLSAYLADSYWGQFADKYHEDCDGIGEWSEENGEWRVFVSDGRIVVEGVGAGRVQVFDIMGRPVECANVGSAVTDSPEHSRIGTSPLPAGLYLVRVGGRGGCKVVVLR